MAQKINFGGGIINKTDLQKMERLVKTASSFIEQFDEATRRDLIGEWRVSSGRLLRDDLSEFIRFFDRQIERAG